ncbi:hypothetical protein V6N13_085606 [Hibiscus sabdariffa]
MPQDLSPTPSTIIITKFPYLSHKIPSNPPMRAYPLSSLFFLRPRSATPQFSPSFPRHCCLTCHVSEEEEKWDSSDGENEAFAFEDGDGVFAGDGMKRLQASVIEVRELEELPEQWRRSKLAWLCKELPAHKAGTLVKILNAQKKWLKQEDATYSTWRFIV